MAAMAALVLALPVGAAAQDFGVMNSAETINKGNFKLTGYPMVVFGKDNSDNQTGVAVAGGYGFTDRFDVEAKVAVSPGIGFGDYGDGHVRFALIENEHRTRQAVRGIREFFRRDGLISTSGA